MMEDKPEYNPKDQDVKSLMTWLHKVQADVQKWRSRFYEAEEMIKKLQSESQSMQIRHQEYQRLVLELLEELDAERVKNAPELDKLARMTEEIGGYEIP